MILKSCFITAVAVLIAYGLRVMLKTDLFLPDVGGLGAFVTVFGTLYGIMAAFVVFEVWGQYNQTSKLVDQEALGLERLYRLTIYFRDDALTRRMHKAIEKYAQLIISDRFQHMGHGEHNKVSSKAFRDIAQIIRNISFDDDHDQTVFNHVVEHYGGLSTTRTERISQSHIRLPVLLKFFLYSSSFVALFTFIIMPFGNAAYGSFAVGSLAFVVGMILQLVEDLDNPFVGHWNITTEPFDRALKHIEKDY